MSDRPGDDDNPTAPPAAGGGFAWGLTPRAETQPPVTPASPPEPFEPLTPIVPAWTPATAAPIAPSPVPPPLIEPAAPAPTVAWTPPPLEPEVPEEPRVPAMPAEAAPPPSWDQPTQLIDEVAPAAAAPSPAAPSPAEPSPVPPAHDPDASSALDALFGEQNFRDYDAEPVAVVAPLSRAERRATPDPSAPRAGVSRTQKVLLGVVGGLVAVLALAALFLLGTRLPALIGPAPVVSPSASPSPSPSPTPTVEAVGPVAVGTWKWNELRGGECLDPFTDPWVEEFTVVDCAAPHPAQLVYRGTFAPSAEGVTDDPFPGAEALQAQLSLLCTAPGVIDLGAAGQFPDVQFQGSYPATQEQWDAGERHYYCFVNRSSGEPLTGSIAVPPPAPAA